MGIPDILKQHHFSTGVYFKTDNNNIQATMPTSNSCSFRRSAWPLASASSSLLMWASARAPCNTSMVRGVAG